MWWAYYFSKISLSIFSFLITVNACKSISMSFKLSSKYVVGDNFSRKCHSVGVRAIYWSAHICNSTHTSYTSENNQDKILSLAICTSNIWMMVKSNGIFFSNKMSTFRYKVHIFWESHKILHNLYCRFDWHYIGQIYSGDFAKFCGLLRIYELY